MTEKIKQAVAKVDGEAEKINTDMAKIISSHIISTYLKSDNNADCVLDQKKTLEDCLGTITEKAKGLAQNNAAMVEDITVYGWVEKYYGFAVDCTENKIIDLLDFV